MYLVDRSFVVLTVNVAYCCSSRINRCKKQKQIYISEDDNDYSSNDNKCEPADCKTFNYCTG
jgi:hypothetical protein